MFFDGAGEIRDHVGEVPMNDFLQVIFIALGLGTLLVDCALRTVVERGATARASYGRFRTGSASDATSATDRLRHDSAAILVYLLSGVAGLRRKLAWAGNARQVIKRCDEAAMKKSEERGSGGRQSIPKQRLPTQT